MKSKEKNQVTTINSQTSSKSFNQASKHKSQPPLPQPINIRQLLMPRFIVPKVIITNFLTEVFLNIFIRSNRIFNNYIFQQYIKLPITISDKIYNYINNYEPTQMSLSKFTNGLYNFLFTDYSDKINISFRLYNFNINTDYIHIKDVLLLLTCFHLIENKDTTLNLLENLINNFFNRTDKVDYDNYLKKTKEENSDLCILLFTFINNYINILHKKELILFKKIIDYDSKNEYSNYCQIYKKVQIDVGSLKLSKYFYEYLSNIKLSSNYYCTPDPDDSENNNVDIDINNDIIEDQKILEDLNQFEKDKILAFQKQQVLNPIDNNNNKDNNNNNKDNNIIEIKTVKEAKEFNTINSNKKETLFKLNKQKTFNNNEVDVDGFENFFTRNHLTLKKYKDSETGEDKNKNPNLNNKKHILQINAENVDNRLNSNNKVSLWDNNTSSYQSNKSHSGIQSNTNYNNYNSNVNSNFQSNSNVNIKIIKDEQKSDMNGGSFNLGKLNRNIIPLEPRKSDASLISCKSNNSTFKGNRYNLNIVPIPANIKISASFKLGDPSSHINNFKQKQSDKNLLKIKQKANKILRSSTFNKQNEINIQPPSCKGSESPNIVYIDNEQLNTNNNTNTNTNNNVELKYIEEENENFLKNYEYKINLYKSKNELNFINNSEKKNIKLILVNLYIFYFKKNNNNNLVFKRIIPINDLYPQLINITKNKVQIILQSTFHNYLCSYDFIGDNPSDIDKFISKIKERNKIRDIQNDFDFGTELGHGKFGHVIIAKYLRINYNMPNINNMNRKFAIKIVKKQCTNEEEYKINRWEMDIFSKLINIRHPNIVKCYRKYESYKHIYFVYEYIKGVDLKEYIKSNFNIQNKINVIDLIHQLINGVYCLHKFGIVHRDIKTTNVMVNSEGTLKILDFGLSRILGAFEYSNDPYGSLCYKAPELIVHKPYNFKVDVWAMGITIYYIIFQYLPFDSDDKYILKQKIVSDDFSLLLNKCNSSFNSEYVFDIIRETLIKNEKDRPDIFRLYNQYVNNYQSFYD